MWTSHTGRMRCGGARSACVLYACRELATACACADAWVEINRSHSDLCSVKAWRPLQFPAGDAKPAFFAFRPPVPPPDALPAALVSPVFAHFLDDMRGAPVLDRGAASVRRAVAQLCSVMPCAFSTEADRRTVVEPHLKRLLDCEPFSQPADSSGARPDAFVELTFGEPPDDLRALLAVVEWKNEMSSADPYFQGQAYYGRFWTGDAQRRRTLLRTDACPALMLEVVGPMLRVCALATLRGNRVQCEPLTPFMHFFAMPGQPEYMCRLLALAAALRRAMRALHAHYHVAALRAAPPAVPERPLARDPALALPYAVRALDSAAKPLCPGKLLYVTEATSGSRVCAKLVAGSYGADVHRLWAGHALAPQLLAVQRLPGDWTLVTMEYLAPPEWMPATAWCSARDAAGIARARAAVAAALKRAHALSLDGDATVHGDCRGVNVLVRCAEGAEGTAAEVEVRFVDFDWAGTQGGARTYGPLLSTEILWPVGVQPGAPLEQTHDAEWLTRDAWPLDA